MIEGNLPEVLTFDLNWATEPASSNVLKVLSSLPQTFDVTDIFGHPLQKNEKYVLRGFICKESSHYLAFFRRIYLKIGFLSGLVFERIALQTHEIKQKEMQEDTEWILYNDDQVSFVRQNWSSVIAMCLE